MSAAVSARPSGGRKCLNKHRAPAQDSRPQRLLGTTFYTCTLILASKLDVPLVSYFPAGPFEPFFTTLWRGSNRRAFLPNPLSYFPQQDMCTTTQHMVSIFGVTLLKSFAMQNAMCHSKSLTRTNLVQGYLKRLANLYLFARAHVIDYRYNRPAILEQL